MSHEETEEAHLLVSSVDDHEDRRREIIKIKYLFDDLEEKEKAAVIAMINAMLNGDLVRS
jgi:hypothetical protein